MVVDINYDDDRITGNANEKDEISSVTLPDHLLVEQILSRLPVKPVIRFKSVSKFYHSVISSPEFTKSHLKSSSSSGQCILLTHSPYKLITLSYDDRNNLKSPIELDFSLDLSFKQQLQPETGRYVGFAGSCNGLVCFYNQSRWRDWRGTKQRGFFFICNPAMHLYREITSPVIANPGFSLEYFWFGYIPSIHDYKIVAQAFDASFYWFIYVFSMRTGKWNRICDIHELLHVERSILSLEKMVVFEDFLYWSFELPDVVDEWKTKRIVGFDLVNEQLKEFPWMDWLNRYKKLNFFVMNGCLSLLCTPSSTSTSTSSSSSSSSPSSSDVWMLKQGDEWSCWEKSYSFESGDMNIVDITPSGKILARGYKEPSLNRVKIIDPTQDNPEQSSLDISDWNLSRQRGGGYVESLISPFSTFQEETHQV
ncbi:hypothetical protein SOVF_022090 [Spinacia oleracea]|nr:hypothetical protein SOVF_022090 [Spinacia oleracea]